MAILQSWLVLGVSRPDNENNLNENKLNENKLCEISDVSLKDDEVYVRFFTGLYTRWKKVEATDEIVFNDVNYKIM